QIQHVRGLRLDHDVAPTESTKGDLTAKYWMRRQIDLEVHSDRPLEHQLVCVEAHCWSARSDDVGPIGHDPWERKHRQVLPNRLVDEYTPDRRLASDRPRRDASSPIAAHCTQEPERLASDRPRRDASSPIAARGAQEPGTVGATA